MPIPNSLPWMESADAKVKRAKLHLDTFSRDAAAWTLTARPTFIRKTNTEQTEHWLVFFVEDPFPPIELSAVVGDVLYNLRSALDSLVCGLVRKGTPSSPCEGQFPIFNDSAHYPKARNKYLKDVPEEARKVIDTLQPFNRPEGTRDIDPLFLLNSLCNEDKHQSTLLTLCYHRDVELLIPLKHGAPLHIKLPKSLYAAQPDTVPLPGRPDSIDENVSIKIVGRSVLLFRRDGPMPERPADEVLVACLNYVEHRVIPALKPFFE